MAQPAANGTMVDVRPFTGDSSKQLSGLNPKVVSSLRESIDIIDGSALTERLVVVPTVTENVPVFRYGFSSVVYNNSVYVFGGCKNGGYSGDCNGKWSSSDDSVC